MFSLPQRSFVGPEQKETIKVKISKYLPYNM